ncbi:MAG: capsid cement protein [bacterium]
MANTSGTYQLPYPESSDAVNVHGDIQQLATSVSTTFQTLDLSVIQVSVINNSGVTITAGDPVYATGYTTATTIAKAISSTSPILGLAKQTMTSGQTGIVVVAGVLNNINTSSFTAGDVLYVDTNGGLTKIRPEGGSGAVGIVVHAVSSGSIIVEAKGNGTWGALKAGLA